MKDKFFDRFMKNLDPALPFLVFIALSAILAFVYYAGVKSGMIVAGSWAWCACLIGPATFGVSMLLALAAAFFRAARGGK